MADWSKQPFNQPTSQAAKQTTSEPTNRRTASKMRQDGCKIQPKSSKLGTKIHQVGNPNPPKSVLEALLDGSGCQVGPRWIQEPRRSRKSTKHGANLEAKIHQKSSQKRTKMRSVFFRDQFVAKLGSTWEPKPSQN